MPITAASFQSEHFEPLVRGLEAARDAFKQRDATIESAHQRISIAESELSQLKDALPTVEQWHELIVKIEDMERRIITPRELIDHARRQFGPWYESTVNHT